MIRLLTMTLILSMFVSNIMAQNTDGGATSILNAVAKKYQAFTSMSINYTFKVEKDKKVLQTMTGTIKVKGDKYAAKLGDQAIYCDGKSIWNYQKESEEVSIFEFDPTDKDNILNPSNLLSGWSKIYSAKFIREETQNNKILQVIDLKPLKRSDIYKVRIMIDKNKKELYAMSTFEVDNTVSTYYIDKFVANSAIDDAQFVFDVKAHPEVEVNDMR
ncbi:MAG: outer membrane lipoprotein carrier protein LolA [Bacteroidales bacterium]|nr:outer membrane lipoprotein carrier protein LolA [Bacteroidales bacterium]